MQQYQSRQLLSPKSPYCPYSATGLTMCNDYGNHIPYDDYLAAFSQTRIPWRWPKAAQNLEPRDDIWPTDVAPVIRQTGDGPGPVPGLGPRPRFGLGSPRLSRYIHSAMNPKALLSRILATALAGRHVPAVTSGFIGR